MSTKVEAEVVGLVWKVAAKPGDVVRAGDPIVIVESMKMEIPIAAEADGKLLRLHVKEGDPVAEGQLIAEIG